MSRMKDLLADMLDTWDLYLAWQTPTEFWAIAQEEGVESPEQATRDYLDNCPCAAGLSGAERARVASDLAAVVRATCDMGEPCALSG